MLNFIVNLDFSITTTCNGNQPEIINQAVATANSTDRTGLVYVVFMIKLRSMMSFMKNEKLLGNIAAYFGIVESQKCSLLSARCTFILD